jgi:L-amino acid N-acyltransferase YncA
METTIQPMTPENWPQVRSIYLEGLATGLASFEVTAPTWEEWDQSHLPCCRLLVCWQEQVAGWAALSPVSRRAVYAGAAETSIYISAAAQGKGLGKLLLNALITESEQVGIWTLQAVIFAENVASQSLYLTCGFRMVGHRERIAQRGGVWHDTVLMERRSRITGIN